MEKQKVEKIIAIIVWAIALGIWYIWGIWYAALGVLVLHLFEFVKAIPLGKAAGKSYPYIIIMNLIFGITWWKYLEVQKED
jgi:hypothetical protein